MLALLLEILLALVVEVFGEVLVEIAIDLGLVSLRHALGTARPRRPALAALGLVLLGSFAGAVSAFARPEPVLPQAPFPGISLLIAPLATGLIMRHYGTWRRARGHETSSLSTFWGGALGAFALAVTRFWLTR